MRVSVKGLSVFERVQSFAHRCGLDTFLLHFHLTDTFSIEQLSSFSYFCHNFNPRIHMDRTVSCMHVSYLTYFI